MEEKQLCEANDFFPLPAKTLTRIPSQVSISGLDVFFIGD